VNEDQLQALVARGEGQRTAFKGAAAAAAAAADLARALAALANSGGGTLLVGVGDNGPILARARVRVRAY